MKGTQMKSKGKLLSGAKLGLILLLALCAVQVTGRRGRARARSQRPKVESAEKAARSDGPKIRAADSDRAKYERLKSAHLVSEKTGWALTETRLLWTTTSGRQWRNITPPLPKGKVLEAFFIDPSTGWSVLVAPYDRSGTDYLVIAFTSNGGSSWSFAELLSPADYSRYEPSDSVSVHFVDAVHGHALVKLASSSNFSRGLLLESSDGGASWRKLPDPPAGGSVRFVTEKDGWLAGGPEIQKLYVTRDGGFIWSPVLVEPQGGDRRAAEPNFDLPTFKNQDEGTLPVTYVSAGGTDLSFYETSDRGRTWRIKQTVSVSGTISKSNKVPSAVVASNLFVIAPPGRLGVTVVADGQARDKSAVVKDLGPGAGISEVNFKSSTTGWVLVREGQCAEFKSQCDQVTRLFATDDGAETLTDVTPQVPSPQGASLNVEPTNSAVNPDSVIASGNRKGFDKCAADTVSNMQVWWNSSPYYDANIYIGGVNRGCSQSNLNSSWVNQVFAQGWGLIPTWVGPQATCTTCTSCSVMSSDPATAASQGVSEANSAASAAAALGLTNTIIYYDLERYNPTTSCQNSVRSFVNAWVQQMHAKGNLAGVYGSPQNAQDDWAGIANPPDAVWIAKWDGNASVFGLTPLSDSLWVNGQRIHQYQGGHNESYGGVTFNIDNDFDDAPVAWLAAQTAPNLTPYQPSGWSDKVVVSNVTGTNTDGSSLKTNDTLYVDWAVLNNGTAATATTFYTKLYVDGVERTSWFTNPPLAVNSYTYVQDYSLGSLSAGPHTIKIVADATSAITESNESDNEYTKTITVTSPGQPNLTPYQPTGWSGKIVISNTTGTNTDSSPLKATDTLYVDWAVLNNGTAATATTFYTKLYVDGTERTSWYTDPPLNVNFYVNIQDYSLGSLSAGPHTIKVVTDATSAISESNESDNEYTKTITVTSGSPIIRIEPTTLNFNQPAAGAFNIGPVPSESSQTPRGGIPAGLPFVQESDERVQGTRESATATSVVNFAELARADAQKPEARQGPRFVPEPEEEEEVRDRPVPPGAKVVREVSQMTDAVQPLGPSPAASPSFQAVSATGWFPPDTQGVAGPNHLMAAVNGGVLVQSKTGSNIGLVRSLSTFFSTVTNGSSDVFDPRIQYDSNGGRWILIADADRKSAASAILVGVSQTSDPTGNWDLSRIDADSANQSWADYPMLGFNKDWIVVSANMFANPGSSAQFYSRLYVLNKANFYAGGTNYTELTAPNGVSGTIVPATTYDTSLATEYLLQNWSGNSGGSGYLRLYSITGAVGSEALNNVSSGVFISTPNPWSDGGGNIAPQLGTSNKIQVNDASIENVVYRNGSLWTAHSVFLPASGATRSSIQWWQIEPTSATVQQRGRIDDASGNLFYGFPSIAVNSNSDVLIGYSRFSSTQYAGAAYAYRAGGDPVNSLRDDTVLKAGGGAYYMADDGGRNRWGDYSGTSVDPADNKAFWTIQEYAASTDTWGTWWGRVSPADTGSPGTFTIYNDGTATLTITGITKQNNSSWLSFSPPSSIPFNIAPGASAQVTVSVSPAGLSSGSYSDRLLVSSNDSPRSPYPGGVNVTLNVSSQTPSPPTANAATSVTGSGFTANWGSSGGATGYRLDVSTSSSFGSYVSGYQNLDVGNVLSRSVGGLSAGTTYYYRVRAYNAGGTSGNSGIISVTTTSTSSLRIDNVTPKAGRASGGQQVTLTGAFAGLSSVTFGGTPVSWSYTSGTSAIAFTTPTHAAGAVSIVLTPASGSTLTKSNAFAYLPTVFTDNTLIVGTTEAKAQHVIELRQAVDAMRAVAGLSPAPWTDPVLVNFVTPVKAVYIIELRTYLEDAASRLGYATASYTDPALGMGSVIKRVHIEELRQRVRNIAG
jgi:hypothetical protein